MQRVPKPKPQTAARILDAAFAVLATHGFTGGTMERIAVRANVSKPTLYTYFGSKEQLFAALLDQQKDRLLEPLAHLADHGMVGAMVRFAEAYARFALDPRTLAFGRMVIGEGARLPGIGRMYLEAGPDQAVRGIMRFMDRMRVERRLDFDDAELAAQDFWTLILSTPRAIAHIRPDLPFAALTPWRYVENGLAVFLRAYSRRPVEDLHELGQELAALRQRQKADPDQNDTGVTAPDQRESAQ